jgi:FkbM family methyltransferase
MWNNVKPGAICVDVGANHGYFSLLLADLAGPNGFLYSVEPNPRLFDLLNRTINLSGFRRRSKVVQAAIGSGPGELPLLVPIFEPKNARLISEAQAGVPRKGVRDGTEEIHRVPVLALDDLVEGAADFIKIDVEGAEEAVWAGMQKLLDRSPKARIAMEVNPHRCKDPEKLLTSIASRFALREIGFDAKSHPISASEIMSRKEDTMLDLFANN